MYSGLRRTSYTIGEENTKWKRTLCILQAVALMSVCACVWMCLCACMCAVYLAVCACLGLWVCVWVCVWFYTISSHVATPVTTTVQIKNGPVPTKTPTSSTWLHFVNPCTPSPRGQLPSHPTCMFSLQGTHHVLKSPPGPPLQLWAWRTLKVTRRWRIWFSAWDLVRVMEAAASLLELTVDSSDPRVVPRGHTLHPLPSPASSSATLPPAPLVIQDHWRDDWGMFSRANFQAQEIMKATQWPSPTGASGFLRGMEKKEGRDWGSSSTAHS